MGSGVERAWVQRWQFDRGLIIVAGTVTLAAGLCPSAQTDCQRSLSTPCLPVAYAYIVVRSTTRSRGLAPSFRTPWRALQAI
ncbi:hypothetical protein BDW74DRAFT_143253 [Aspergillus multicolor]|uniref:uncharacterized protein n=1 Tax=Aspergillus multicolor TaxID=41759 RepID=UPI003CCDF596